jgi:hypothetical protein
MHPFPAKVARATKPSWVIAQLLVSYHYYRIDFHEVNTVPRPIWLTIICNSPRSLLMHLILANFLIVRSPTFAGWHNITRGPEQMEEILQLLVSHPKRFCAGLGSFNDGAVMPMEFKDDALVSYLELCWGLRFLRWVRLIALSIDARL